MSLIVKGIAAGVAGAIAQHLALAAGAGQAVSGLIALATIVVVAFLVPVRR